MDILMEAVPFLRRIIPIKYEDGALHMLSIIGNVLIKKKAFTRVWVCMRG